MAKVTLERHIYIKLKIKNFHYRGQVRQDSNKDTKYQKLKRITSFVCLKSKVLSETFPKVSTDPEGTKEQQNTGPRMP